MRRIERGRHPWELSEWLRRRKLRVVKLVEHKDKAVLVVVANGRRMEKGVNVANGKRMEKGVKVAQLKLFGEDDE